MFTLSMKYTISRTILQPSISPKTNAVNYGRIQGEGKNWSVSKYPHHTNMVDIGTKKQYSIFYFNNV